MEACQLCDEILTRAVCAGGAGPSVRTGTIAGRARPGLGEPFLIAKTA